MRNLILLVLVFTSVVTSAQLDERNPSVVIAATELREEADLDQFEAPITDVAGSMMLQQPQLVHTDLSHRAFFCRIEDQIAQKSGINFKFRLGSVQYVDALEGKGYFEAVSHSQTTNFQMSRKQ